MAWEDVKGRGGGGGGNTPLGENEVSIVQTTNKDKIFYRLNVSTKHFPEGTKSVRMRIDRDKKRIGLFVLPEAEIWDGKALSSYSKRNKNIRYLTLPRVVMEIGFTKGRYEIKKPKEDTADGMYFYISTKSKKGDTKEETPA